MNNIKNYKADYYNPETFEKSEIETKIPADLVNQVKQTLDNIEGYMITPTMINPEDNSVVFCVMNISDRTLKYKVTISPNNQIIEMSNNKQSSVSWLAKSYLDLLTKLNNDEISLEEFEIKYIEILEQSKAMHKEETIDAIIKSEKEHYINAEVYPPEFVLRKAEQYYNETFGGNNEQQ